MLEGVVQVMLVQPLVMDVMLKEVVVVVWKGTSCTQVEKEDVNKEDEQ